MHIHRVLTALLFAMLSLLGFSAHAAGPDLSSLSGAVDFATVIVAVLAVAGAAVLLELAWKGAQKVLAAVKRA